MQQNWNQGQVPGGYAPQQDAQGMQGAPPQGFPPGYQGAGGAAPGGGKTGFVRALFDLSFENMVATKVIKVLYVLFLFLLGLGMVGGVISAIMMIAVTGEVIVGFVMLLILPIVGAVQLILMRMYFELLVVMFKIAEDIDEVAKNTRKT